MLLIRLILILTCTLFTSVGIIQIIQSVSILRDHRETLEITEGRIQAPDGGEWRDLTNEELKIMNENLKVEISK
jgi:hypothetical protein